MTPYPAILSCSVFQHELAQLKAPHQPIRYLEMGLHDQPDQLRMEIQEAIHALDAAPQTQAISLAFALCGNSIIGIHSGRCPLLVSQAHDCFAILLGGMRAYQCFKSKHPHAYGYSPGWIEGKRVPGPDRSHSIRAEFEKKYPDDPDLVEDLIEADTSTFAPYHEVAYVDCLPDESAKTYCKTCAKHLGWGFVNLPGDPSLLKALVNADERHPALLKIPPHHRIVAGSTPEKPIASAPLHG